MVQTRSAKASLSHEERTATEPRDETLYTVQLEKVLPVNDRIKTFRFSHTQWASIKFLPGQWLDVHVPGIEKAGGFTITSSPRQATPGPTENHYPFVDLAVQKSPDNPPAAWLWQPEEDIIGKELKVRVGGSFVWPPPAVNLEKVNRAVFIAGGVGINPLISILKHFHEEQSTVEARLLYSTKVPSRATQPTEVLFLPELLDLFRKPRSQPSKNRLELFLTGAWDGSKLDSQNDEPIQPLMSLTLPKLESDTEVPITAWTHRIDEIALLSAVGKREEASSSVFYVCGPADMTDGIVEFIQKQQHVEPERVLCEKWW